VPTGFAAVPRSTTSLLITWAASSDNVGVIGYQFWRGTTNLGTTPTPDWLDTGLQPDTTYSYRARAIDAAGNLSAFSAAFSAKTPAVTSSPTPTPTSTSSGGNNCRPNPGACGFPNAANTGVPAGVALTVVNGNVTLSTAGMVYEGKDVHGCIRVTASNVTIRNSRISCPDTETPGGAYTRVFNTSPNLTIVDSEINCQGGYGIAVGESNYNLLRVDITNCENGGHINANVTVRDSWIHGLTGGADGHFDGFQFGQGGGNVVIERNTIDNPNSQTSAIIMWDEENPQNADVLIQNNLLAGGGYTLYCGKFGTAVNVKILGNRFATGFYGNSTNCAAGGEVWSGNVYDFDGSTILPAP
jgi:hypothetical protein